MVVCVTAGFSEMPSRFTQMFLAWQVVIGWGGALCPGTWPWNYQGISIELEVNFLGQESTLVPSE